MATFQSLTERSSLVDATYRPSGLNATFMTRLECPRKVRTSIPVSTFQSFTV